LEKSESGSKAVRRDSGNFTLSNRLAGLGMVRAWLHLPLTKDAGASFVTGSWWLSNVTLRYRGAAGDSEMLHHPNFAGMGNHSGVCIASFNIITFAESEIHPNA
jgi:hypothetical protein